MNQLTTALEEVSRLGVEISAVKEKSFYLQQKMASMESPSPLDVVASLCSHASTNSKCT